MGEILEALAGKRRDGYNASKGESHSRFEKMIKARFAIIKALGIVLGVLALSGCQRSSGEVWEDTKTAGHYAQKGIASLFGSHGESRMVNSYEEFAAIEDPDFVPLQDEGLFRQMSMGDYTGTDEWAQPVEVPGERGSTLPGIEAFQNAEGHPEFASVFENIHFPYNSDLIKGEDYLSKVQRIASYMKKNPDVYVFVEGHCDERGSAAYNLALGSRRSNSVRSLLIKQGVDMERIFTISYGKEKPLAEGHEEKSWWKNRRAQFRVYRKGRG